MAKPNYAFAKRQRDLAKKQKKEEKLAEKRLKKAETEGQGLPAADASPEVPGAPTTGTPGS